VTTTFVGENQFATSRRWHHPIPGYRTSGAVRGICNQILRRRLMWIRGQGPATFWCYDPLLLDALPRRERCVLHLVDRPGEWNSRSRGNPSLGRLWAAAKADWVLVSSERLKEELDGLGIKAVVAHNCVDEARFWYARRSVQARSRVGYVGAIGGVKLDLRRLWELARVRADLDFVLVGPVIDRQSRVWCQTAWRDLPNTSWQPAVGYDAVPGVLRSLDAGIMVAPCSIYSAYSSPLKALELIASGRAIVTTSNLALDHVKRGRFVGDTVTELSAALDMALEASDTDCRVASDAVRSMLGWSARADRISGVLGERWSERWEIRL
jgi:hypothetical protein